MTETRLTPVAGAPRAFHGEGPVWDAQVGRLRWVDMLAGDVLTTDPATGATVRLRVGDVAAAVRPRRGGGLVVGVERGFALVDADETSVDRLPELWSDPAVRMNEGGCDPRGRFYCGSMAYDVTPGVAALHRLDPDRTVTTVLTGVTLSNGLCWNADGTLAYYVDSELRTVDVFDVDPADGALHQRRTLVAVPAAVGKPDGLTVDAEGGVWVALWGGGAVHRYTPTGELDTRLAVPATNVTACAFGGVDLDELFVTTSQEGAPASDGDASGVLYRARPGVRGLPVLEFAG